MLKILGQSDPDLQRYLRHTHGQTHRQKGISCFYRELCQCLPTFVFVYLYLLMLRFQFDVCVDICFLHHP